MDLPVRLKDAVEQAHLQLLTHPQHALLPNSRLSIYEALGSSNDSPTGRARLQLSILTVHQVLPQWDKNQPTNSWPRRLLAVSEGVLNESISRENARKEADEAWAQLEELGISHGSSFLSGEAFSVLLAAVETVFEASGRFRFNASSIKKEDTDALVDPWSSDVAKWAATASAGAIWDPTSDIQKRKLFWEWWLFEAIPAAWQTAQ